MTSSRWILAVLFAVLIAGSAAPISGQSLPLATIGSSAYNVPQIAVASAMNLWKPAGDTPKVVTFASGPLALGAPIGGQVDFMTTAELRAVTGSMRNNQFAIVAEVSQFHGNRIIANFPIASVAALAGKKVGTVLGTISQFFLESDLKKSGVKAVVVNIAPSDFAPALARGDIDAALPFLDAIPLAKKALGDRYHEIRIPEETDFVLIASPDMVTKHPEVLHAVLVAMLGVDKAIKANPSLAQTEVSQAMDGALSVDQINAIWLEYDFQTRLDQGLPDLMTLEGEWIAAGGMIKNATPSNQLFRGYIDAAPLRALSPAAVTLK